MKDIAEWVLIIFLVFGIWVWDDPRRAGQYMSEFMIEFQQGVIDGQRGY